MIGGVRWDSARLNFDCLSCCVSLHWHMVHPLVFLSGSWQCLQHTWDTQLQSFSGHVVMHSSSLRKLECVLNLIMFIHTHTHSHITFASWADRKEKRSNKHDFFVFLRGKWWCVRRLQETFPLFYMAQKDKCVTVKWQKQLYTASTCFAKLAEIPQWWWSWVHADPVGFVLVCGTVLLTGNHETMHSRSFYGVMKVL